MTNEGRVEFSNRFDPRETASSSPSSMLINMGVSSALLKTIAPNPAVTHEPPSHTPATDNDNNGLPNIESDTESSISSDDFVTGPSLSGFAQLAPDLADSPSLWEQLNGLLDKGLPSSESTPSPPSTRGSSAPEIHLPMGLQPEGHLSHASGIDVIGKNYLSFSYAIQMPTERPAHRSPSLALGRGQTSVGMVAEGYGRCRATEPSYFEAEMGMVQGAGRMGGMTGGQSSSYGLPMEGKGRKRALEEMGDEDEDEGSSARPARQKLRSDRTLGATVPRDSAFMAGQQQGLEPLHNNQAIGMGDQCDGEGRPLNLAKAFSLGHREG